MYFEAIIQISTQVNHIWISYEFLHVKVNNKSKYYKHKVPFNISLVVEIVCEKLQRIKEYMKHVTEASLEFNVHLGHSSFNFLNGVKFTN